MKNCIMAIDLRLYEDIDFNNRLVIPQQRYDKNGLLVKPMIYQHQIATLLRKKESLCDTYDEKGIMASLDYFSNRRFLSELLTTLANHYSAQIAQSSYLHANGFYKLLLLSSHDKSNLRLHIRMPGQAGDVEENVHDHRWHFGSKMLWGSYQMFEWKEFEQGSYRYYHYKYKRSASEIKFPKGIQFLEIISDSIYIKGDKYFMDDSRLHSIKPIEDQGFITLVLTGPKTKDSCKLYAKQKIPANKIELVHPPLTQKQVYELILFALRKLYLRNRNEICILH
jgi:hypothetical protein